jgi:hypothetical protein
MAINIPIVTDFNSKGLQDARNAFDNFKTKVGEAEGAFGKMKAGFGAASDFVKANAAAMASAAGAAIAGFAIKAVTDFQDLALEVDKFSNVTRVAAEDASRWIEVAGDFGIEAGAVEGAINKMNKSLASSRDEYEKLGIEIVRTKDGTIDANETFINTVDAIGKIKDPAQRAKVATELLGKSWTQVSELVEMGAGSLRSALQGVADAKLIDEAEIQKAKDFRAAQDQLRDAFESVAITIGSELVPMITQLLESVAPVAEKAGFFARAWKTGFGAMTGNVKLLQDGLTGGSGSLDESINEVTMSFWEQQQQMYRNRYEALQLTDQFDALDDTYSELKGNIDERQAWRNLQDDIKQAGDAALAAFKEKTPEALRASEAALDRARLAAADYILKLEDIPEQMKTDIIAGLDNASVAQIEATLAHLARPRVAGIIVGVGETPSEVRGRGTRSDMSFATPGAVNIMPTSTTGSGNVIVNVGGSVTTENDLIESVRKGLVNAQRNGSGLVYNNF